MVVHRFSGNLVQYRLYLSLQLFPHRESGSVHYYYYHRLDRKGLLTRHLLWELCEL